MDISRVVVLASIVVLLVSGCGQAAPTYEPARRAPALAVPLPSPSPQVDVSSPSSDPYAYSPGPTAGPSPVAWPDVYDYNLGSYTIAQNSFGTAAPDKDLRLDLLGILAVPQRITAAPLVVLFHGRHNICDIYLTVYEEDPWPCPGDSYIRNDHGLRYLAEGLAARGYLAMAIDLNAEHLDSFGELPFGLSASAIFEQHMAALAHANQGQAASFGVDLHNRVDFSRIMLIGHSRGADYAVEIARQRLATDDRAAIARGQGPIGAILQVAPAMHMEDPARLIDLAVPTAIILPECDFDVDKLEGQSYFDQTRLAADWQGVLALVYMQSTNHNFFNDRLPADMDDPGVRMECRPDQRLPRETQRRFLVDYAGDFADFAFGELADPGRAGLDPAAPAPARLYDVPVLTSLLMPRSARFSLLIPDSARAAEWGTDESPLRLAGPLNLEYCSDDVPCDMHFVQPGTSIAEQVVISWLSQGDTPSLRIEIPSEQADLSAFASLGMRVALDPYSEWNPVGQGQSFRVVLHDTQGQSSSVTLSAREPALAYPDARGGEQPRPGFVELSALRVPLSAFAGVDLSQVSALELVFDQQPAGRLYMADVEFIGGLR